MASHIPYPLRALHYADGKRRPWVAEITGRDERYRRVCKVLLANDYWCKGLGFGPTKAENHERYVESVRRKIEKWSGAC